MTSINRNSNQGYKVCACKNCTNSVSKLMEINYIYKKGWFCDICATDISFHGLGREIFENEQ